MENVKKRSVDSGGDEGGGLKKEVVDIKVGNKRPYHQIENLKLSSSSTSPEHTDFSISKQVAAASNKERSAIESHDSKASSSNQMQQDEQLESAKAEMGEVREENQRLKSYLDRMMKDYKTLQMQFYDIIQRDHEETKKKPTDAAGHDHDRESNEELVSLSLGRFSNETEKQGKNYKSASRAGKDEDHEKSLSLGLDCKFEASKSDAANESLPNASPVNSVEEPKEEGGGTWPPSKVLKTARSGGEDEVLQQNPVKKARVSVRARCDTPTMNDGCQWRKYGQKIAKGNPCPRAYYRCTVAPSCPVRKQVQRCPEDMSILITTYEGTHNHSLPISATAMASATSAAASMLLSGATSSSRTTPTTANLHGLNFYLSDNNTTNRQFYYQNSSLSPSPSHPTITLDLTSAPSSSLFNRPSSFSSTYPSSIPKFAPSSSLNFSSSESNPMMMSWINNGFFTYGSGTTATTTTNSSSSHHPPPIWSNRNQPGSLSLYQSYLQKNNLPPQAAPPQLNSVAVVDPIAAATKAITADPSFQSALAAALSSIIGGSGAGGGAANHSGDGGSGENHLVQKTKWGEQLFPVASSGYSTTSSSMSACGSSYLSKAAAASTSSQPAGGGGRSLLFMPPAAGFPLSSPGRKSASASPGGCGGGDKDHSS